MENDADHSQSSDLRRARELAMKTAALTFEMRPTSFGYSSDPLLYTLLSAHYEPLLRPDEFRLVALLPHEPNKPIRLTLMNNVTFSNCPYYEAVSYEWGQCQEEVHSPLEIT